MTHDLTLASAVSRAASDRFVWEVPPGWEQGRGAFGGIVVAALSRAVTQCEPDVERLVRAVSLEILSPVLAGTAEISVEELRRGNGVSAFEARVRQHEQGVEVIRARATVTLAKARTSDRDLAPTPPSFPAFESLPRAPITPPLAPTFTQHLDFRPIAGLPFSGADVALVEGWVHAPACSAWGPPEWLGLVDAYWPSPLVRETAPRPMVTLTYTAHVLDVPPRGPLYFRGRALAARDGFVSELRELYAPDGRLVVSNPQVIAIVK